jgi:hypothetical protein
MVRAFGKAMESAGMRQVQFAAEESRGTGIMCLAEVVKPIADRDFLRE